MEDNIRYKSEIVEKILKESFPVMKKKVSTKLKIAFKIDVERKRRNWSKMQLAEHFQKSPSEITKWLSGFNNFTIDTLLEIEDGLKINLISPEEKIEKPKTRIRVVSLIDTTEVLKWPLMGAYVARSESPTSQTSFFKLKYAK